MDIVLYWHPYPLMPYEKKLAQLEVESLLRPQGGISSFKTGIVAKDCVDSSQAEKLVYFASYEIDGQRFLTKQSIREGEKGLKQNTRYYSHGIHEYKGKFNPQVVRGILNIYGRNANSVLDPFCGSGTTLLETRLEHLNSVGVDINPLATFIANTKISVLNEFENVQAFSWDTFFLQYQNEFNHLRLDNDDRTIYLSKWFTDEYLRVIESLRLAAEHYTGAIRDLVLLCVSNILRDYSLQEPSDLRIRRRYSPYPSESLIDRLKKELNTILSKLTSIKEILPRGNVKTHVFNSSINDFCTNEQYLDAFDVAITSPPYATALPYIDTQRLSLVWLSLCEPKDIKSLEGSLIGSREIKNGIIRNDLLQRMKNNKGKLTPLSYDFCMMLQSQLTEKDGFRRKAVPLLLYRYLSEMRQMFSVVFRLLKPSAHYCLVVGYNTTNIGGKSLIDTPSLLSEEAKSVGFKLQTIMPLETYQRYDSHSKNAITQEALIVLEK